MAGTRKNTRAHVAQLFVLACIVYGNWNRMLRTSGNCRPVDKESNHYRHRKACLVQDRRCRKWWLPFFSSLNQPGRGHLKQKHKLVWMGEYLAMISAAWGFWSFVFCANLVGRSASARKQPLGAKGIKQKQSSKTGWVPTSSRLWDPTPGRSTNRPTERSNCRFPCSRNALFVCFFPPIGCPARSPPSRRVLLAGLRKPSLVSFFPGKQVPISWVSLAEHSRPR